MYRKTIGIFICILFFVAGFIPGISGNVNDLVKDEEKKLSGVKDENNFEIEKFQLNQIKENKIDYDSIIYSGLRLLKQFKEPRFKTIPLEYEIKNYISLLKKLEKWYEADSNVEFASIVDRTMTIKFNDGFYVIIIDVLPSFFDGIQKMKLFSILCSLSYIIPKQFSGVAGKNLVVLHPFQWQAAEYPYSKGFILRNFLKNAGYTVAYKENEEVDIGYIKKNISMDVVVNFGHGGYMDVDDDGQGDFVVLSSGESWTNDTPSKYPFEYNNSWIVKVIIWDGTSYRSFIGYTPGLISFYYKDAFPDDSLVFIATCDSIIDYSMAKAFVDDANATSYIGWSKSVGAWPNAIASHALFFLLCKGWTVESTCRIIRFFMFIHRLKGCKLTYYGDGDLTIKTTN